MPNGPRTGEGRRSEMWLRKGPEGQPTDVHDAIHLVDVPPNPNSLANLRPISLAAELPTSTRAGPVITPRMRRMAEHYTLGELLAMDEAKMETAAALARARLLAAADIRNGARDRDAVEDRFDGPVPKQLQVEPTASWWATWQQADARTAARLGIVADTQTDVEP